MIVNWPSLLVIITRGLSIDWKVANSLGHARHVLGKIFFALIVTGMAGVNVYIEIR